MPKKTKVLKPLPSALTVTATAEKSAPSPARKARTTLPKPRTAPRTAAPRTKAPLAPAPGTPAVTFVLANDHAQRVALSGDFNRWSSDTWMSRREDGRWQITLPLAPGQHQYKFVVDGHWLPDPNAQAQQPDGFGGVNSVIDVRE